MKYYIIFACAIALCSAVTLNFPNKEITVDENGITISVPGKTIKFDHAKNDNTTVEVVVKDGNGLYKTIHIDNDKHIVREMTFTKEVELPNNKPTETTTVSRTRRSESNITQIDIPQMMTLVDIFKKYDGVVGEDRFQNLLKDLKEAVDDNKVHSVFLDVLQKIEDKNITTQATVDQKLNATNLEDVDVGKKNDNDTNIPLNITHEDLQTQLTFFGNKDNTSDARVEQLVLKSSIWQIQEQILNQQVAARKLQYQQQFLSKEKQLIELKLKMYEQLGVPEVQCKELFKALENLQKREEELLNLQIEMYNTVEKLNQQLLVQMGKLQQSFKDEQEIKDVV